MDIFEKDNDEIVKKLRKEGNLLLAQVSTTKKELLALSDKKLIKKFSTMTVDEANYILEQKPELLNKPLSPKDPTYIIHCASQNTDVYVLDAVFKACKKHNINVVELEESCKYKTFYFAIEKDRLNNFLYLLNYYSFKLSSLFHMVYNDRDKSSNILKFLLQQDDRFNDCLFNCIQRDYFQKNFNFVNFLKSIDANVHYTNQTKNQSLFALVLSKIDSDMHFDSDQQYFNVLKDCLSFFVSKGCSLGETYNNLYGTTKTVKEIVNQIKDRSFGATFANKIDEMMIEIERLSLSNILNQPKKAGKNLKI